VLMAVGLAPAPVAAHPHVWVTACAAAHALSGRLPRCRAGRRQRRGSVLRARHRSDSRCAFAARGGEHSDRRRLAPLLGGDSGAGLRSRREFPGRDSGCLRDGARRRGNDGALATLAVFALGLLLLIAARGGA
jgi:hypothetical protein